MGDRDRGRRRLTSVLTSVAMIASLLALSPEARATTAPPSEPEATTTADPATAAPPAPSPAPAAPAPASNDLHDGGWAQLLGAQVNVQRLDGVYVYGQLLRFDAASVTILGSDGYAREVSRQQVYSVQLMQPAAAMAPASAPESAPPKTREKPRVIYPKLNNTGNGLVLGGLVALGLGASAIFVGMGVALGELDAGYLLYITVPGLVAVVGLGLPLLIAGANFKKRARGLASFEGPKLVLRDRYGARRLTLAPGAAPGPLGAGLRLRF